MEIKRKLKECLAIASMFFSSWGEKLRTRKKRLQREGYKIEGCAKEAGGWTN
jgi:hypothetical protein